MDDYAITESGQLLPADSHGNLPANVHRVEGFAFTTAPEAYDYWYTHTVADNVVSRDRDGSWRFVAYTDTSRFEKCQLPRYGSGLHPAFNASDDERRECFELPTAAELLERYPC